MPASAAVSPWFTSVRRLALAASALWVGAAMPTEAAPGQIPEMSTKDLNGRDLVLPRDLPGERTLALIGYVQNHQYDIDGWITGLELKSSSIPWVELPVIANYGSIFRWYVDNGMRSGIAGEANRARVVTLYTDPAEFRRQLGLTGDGAQIHVVVLSRRGRVLAKTDGPFSPEKARSILAALR